MSYIDNLAITKAQNVWGWADNPPPQHRGSILSGYNRRFQHVEHIPFPAPPRPWLTSAIDLGQSSDGRWTYCYKISTNTEGLQGGFSVMWCKPYHDKLTALDAAATELHAWLDRAVTDPRTGSHTDADRALATKLHAWLDSLTRPVQLTLF